MENKIVKNQQLDETTTKYDTQSIRQIIPTIQWFNGNVSNQLFASRGHRSKRMARPSLVLISVFLSQFSTSLIKNRLLNISIYHFHSNRNVDPYIQFLSSNSHHAARNE